MSIADQIQVLMLKFINNQRKRSFRVTKVYPKDLAQEISSKLPPRIIFFQAQNEKWGLNPKISDQKTLYDIAKARDQVSLSEPHKTMGLTFVKRASLNHQ